MPTITPQNIKSQLDTLEKLGTAILKWTKDLDSAKAAKTSLAKFQELSSAIATYIHAQLSTTTNEKKGALLASYRDRLNDIKRDCPTKGLTKAITQRIEALEATKLSLDNAKKKETDQNKTALAEVKRLLPLVVATVQAYEKARLEDKSSLLAQLRQERELLNTHIALLSDKSTYPKQVHDLAHQVNLRSDVLAKEEEQLKIIISGTAKQAEVAVDQMTVNEQILAIAPLPVQTAIKKLIAEITSTDLQRLLTGADDSEETSLVAYAAGQIIAVTGRNSAIGKELVLISSLPQDQQLEIITALISGQDNKGVLATVGQSTQMALTAAIINQLALNAKIDKKDQVAIQDFSKSLVSNMARVERGEATHLSVLVEVENYLGQKEIRGFHIDLQALRHNAVDLSALMALELLKIGAKANTPIVTAFTDLPQVGALLQLQGRATSTLTLGGRSLQQLTNDVLDNTSTIKQLTGGEITDVSEGALVAATKYSTSIVRVSSGLGKHNASPKLEGNLVFDVLRALAILNLTVQATVINAVSKQGLGITPLIGNAPRLMIEGIYPRLMIEPNNLVAVAAADQRGIESVPRPLPITDKDAVVEVNAPQKPIEYIKDEQLITNFNTALDKLKSLHDSLSAKYCKNTDKQYIVVANARLIEALDSALVQYNKFGDRTEFQKACEAAINPLKTVYNTHRDGKVKQFFGAIAEALNNVWNAIFGSAESKQTKASLVSFFNSNERTTKSANVLFSFKMDLDKAFGLIGVHESLDQDLENRSQIK